MNKTILRQVARKAVRLPKTFDMHDWARKVIPNREHPCGSIGCIAGNGAIEAGLVFRNVHGIWPKDGRTWDEAGANAFDITSVQARRLFYVANWPKLYQLQYNSSVTRADKGKVIARRIEAFIRSGGKR